MRILIAPDKFKGSLTAGDAAAAFRAGFDSVFSGAEFDLVPVADGGGGAAAIFRHALRGEHVEIASHDALGREITASYSLIPGEIAVIDMSSASGLWRISDDQRDPLRSSTFGTGELVADAIARGSKDLIIGLGGSATNDGGAGMAAALGWKFLDEKGEPVPSRPSEFLRFRRIVTPEARAFRSVTGLCDVKNPLLGELGATKVFGPQKGATPEMQVTLERSLEHLAHLFADQFGIDHANSPGAGAAGGLGFGLLAFCGGSLEPGFQAVSRLMDLENKVRLADLVLTGEGRLDAQSLQGKAPYEIGRLAASHGKPVIGFAGLVDEEFPELDACVPIANGPLTLDESRQRAAELLRSAAERTARLLKIKL